MRRYDDLLDQEHIIARCRQQWNNDVAALQDRTVSARIRLSNARVNSRLHPYLTSSAPVSGPADRLRRGHVTSSGGEDGDTSEDLAQRLRCRFCLWTHKSKDCDTPHYLYSRRKQGRCMVSKAHNNYWYNLPETCPFKGRNKKRTTVKKPGLYMRAEVD